MNLCFQTDIIMRHGFMFLIYHTNQKLIFYLLVQVQ